MKKGGGKKKPKVIVTRASAADIREYLGDRATSMPSMVAWCGRVNGKIVGFGGYFKHQGRWHAYLDLEDKGKDYKFALALVAVRCLKHARDTGIQYIYTELQSEIPGASAFLQRLGFQLDPRTLYYFRWRAY
jgi:GNAT superfamily N-acetyltransferase